MATWEMDLSNSGKVVDIDQTRDPILINIYSESIELSKSMPIYDRLSIYWKKLRQSSYQCDSVGLGADFALERLVWVGLVYLVW